MAVVSFLVPKYRHHKGSGQAFVQVKGNRHYLDSFGSAKSKEAYARFVAELAASPVTTPAPTPVRSADALTVVELADAYWQFCQGYYRKKDGSQSGCLDHIHLMLHKRVIFIGPKAQAIIEPYLLHEPATYCFNPAESEAERHVEMRSHRKSKVQPSQRNRRKPSAARAPKDCYTKDSYARAIRRGVDKANKAIQNDAELFGIEAPKLPAFWAPNRLRHTRATEVRRQFGLEAAQVILGHAKVDVTQVYAERDHALADDVMKKIG
jgi:hypothetical protein